jgi:centrin-1
MDEFLDMVTPRMQSRDVKEEVLKVFALFDDDNTGAISFKNLKRCVHRYTRVTTA